jgi:hypothetical protein
MSWRNQRLHQRRGYRTPVAFQLRAPVATTPVNWSTVASLRWKQLIA